MDNTAANKTELGFVSGETRRKLRDEETYRVMLFRHLGVYPRGTVHVPSGFFHADDQIVFSVVRGAGWRRLDPEAPYSEFNWASPEEIRFLASILLCEKREDAHVMFYPLVGFSRQLDVHSLDLSAAATVEEVRTLLLCSAEAPNTLPGGDSFASCLGKDFFLVDANSYNLGCMRMYWEKLSPRNYVLIRGIYSLIKCDMLCRHNEFWEEALLTLYIALEASFQLVLRVLKENGVPNPSAHDAAVWLHDHFDKQFGHPAPGQLEKYFEEFYEGRVMTLHPSSRYGEFPYSPTMHDDVVFLRGSLRAVFAYLVAGTHGPDYYEDLQHSGRTG